MIQPLLAWQNFYGHCVIGLSQLWQLETLLLQKDTYLSYSQALSYTSQALSQNLQGLRKRGPLRRMSRRFLYYLQENWRRLWILTLWISIMIGLFTWKFIEYKREDASHIMGYCLLTAKGAAETLKFNMALILLPVCRNTITWLRSTKWANIVPFDDNINFHKVRISQHHQEKILMSAHLKVSHGGQQYFIILNWCVLLSILIVDTIYWMKIILRSLSLHCFCTL